MAAYDGPIIDSHHHLWSYRMGHHAWLDPKPVAEGEGLPMGDLAPLRRDYGVEDFLAEAKGQGIVATVHIEALWSGGTEDGETEWLDTLDRSIVAARHVFRVPLEAVDAPARIARAARHPRAAGLRDIVAWHPDPGRAFTDRPHRMADPAWRRGLAALERAGLPFDLLLYPHQMEEAAALAGDFPATTFVLNHCGSPADRSEAGMAAWRAGLARLAECPNVVIKVSNPFAYDHDWSEDSIRAVVVHAFETFGPQRSLYGSDAPVSGLQVPMPRLLELYRAIFAGQPAAVQRAFFHDNAQRLYRLAADG